jgi:hypothetical protein
MKPKKLMRTKKFTYPKAQIKQAEQDNKAYKQALTLLNTRVHSQIDAQIAELKEEEKGAVGSKLTATLKGQNLLHELRRDLTLS